MQLRSFLPCYFILKVPDISYLAYQSRFNLPEIEYYIEKIESQSGVTKGEGDYNSEYISNAKAIVKARKRSILTKESQFSFHSYNLRRKQFKKVLNLGVQSYEDLNISTLRKINKLEE